MSPVEPEFTAEEQAEKLNHDGKNYFSQERYGAAIDAYTQAIALCPNVPVYYTNRALCYRKRNNWERVEADCRKALQLGSNSVKTHYMLGLALLQKQEYRGIKHLEKALDLARSKNHNNDMVEEIWQELANAKYLEWDHAHSKRSQEVQKMKEACITALVEKHFLDAPMEESLKESDYSSLEIIKALDKVFSKAAEADVPTEVPDHLCCKIALDIFRDPVITPSGISYERAMILDHIRQVGEFDPTTREPLYESQLVSNLAIKEAVQLYLENHGWAYKTF